MIPLTLLSRYAIPLIVAAIYLGDVDVPEQFEIFDKTQRLSDQVLSQARGEGQDENGNPEVFDYVIVGGGSAGAVLANRLTQDGSNRVLLLEAGGDPNPIMDVPYAQRYYWTPNNTMDWGYSTVKQNRSCGYLEGYCFWPRGKALGGSSSVNGLVYNLGKPWNYDRWAEFTGDSSWSWDNVKDTYKQLEDYHGYYEDSAGDEHGRGGEIYVGKIDYAPGRDVMEEALREKGYSLGDLNSGTQLTYGFGLMDYNIKNGLRCGTYQAFLEPILNRSNLVIYRYAYAQRVDMDSANTRAVGVTYKRHGIAYSVKAEKEVILSGGTVESAKLLMLSGIGPKEHLEEIGIPTLIDLPVGKYLQEHSGIDLIGKNGGFRVNTTFGGHWNTSENVLEFVQNGTGPFNAFMSASGYAAQSLTGYVNGKQNLDRNKPDVHVYMLSRFIPGNEQAGEEDTQDFYSFLELVNVTSTGSVKLASANPEDKPVIDPNFFENPEEIEILIDVLETMTDIYLNTTAFRRLDIQPLEPFDDHCLEYPFPSRDYWRCFVQQRSHPFLHPTSTCRMGPNAEVAVVDSKLRVFGTENLRVADASVFPFVPSGNTNLPAIMIGAKAAEIILSGQ